MIAFDLENTNTLPPNDFGEWLYDAFNREWRIRNDKMSLRVRSCFKHYRLYITFDRIRRIALIGACKKSEIRNEMINLGAIFRRKRIFPSSLINEIEAYLNNGKYLDFKDF